MDWTRAALLIAIVVAIIAVLAVYFTAGSLKK
jgi:hypothetical protein